MRLLTLPRDSRANSQRGAFNRVGLLDKHHPAFTESVPTESAGNSIVKVRSAACT